MHFWIHYQPMIAHKVSICWVFLKTLDQNCIVGFYVVNMTYCQNMCLCQYYRAYYAIRFLRAPAQILDSGSLSLTCQATGKRSLFWPILEAKEAQDSTLWPPDCTRRHRLYRPTNICTKTCKPLGTLHCDQRTVSCQTSLLCFAMQLQLCWRGCDMYVCSSICLTSAWLEWRPTNGKRMRRFRVRLTKVMTVIWACGNAGSVWAVATSFLLIKNYH